MTTGEKRRAVAAATAEASRYDFPSALEIHAVYFAKPDKIPPAFFEKLARAWVARHGTSESPPNAMALWRCICEDVVTPETDMEVHEALFELNYLDWNNEVLGPPPVWVPSDETAQRARAVKIILRLQERCPEYAKFLAERDGGVSTSDLVIPSSPARELARAYCLLQEFSVHNQQAFWPFVFNEIGVRFRKEPTKLFDYGGVLGFSEGSAPVAGRERWFAESELNVADTCFLNQSVGAPEEQVAIVWAREGHAWNQGENADREALRSKHLRTWTYAELLNRSCRIANCLKSVGLGKGSRVGICMPMTAESVAIYLAVVMSGGAVIGIADSFSRHEIKTRLRVAAADAVITQDALLRGSKYISLYDRVSGAAEDYKQDEGKAVQVICLPADLPSGFAPEQAADQVPELRLRCELRPVDMPYLDFIALSTSQDFESVPCAPQDVTNILFSSGTTGEPKAIPWDHVVPLKCAVDAMLHHDIQQQDVVCWPTNLGWMMGPWLLYAGLVNGAAVAIFEGSPLGTGFCQFVETAGVTMLGTVPSIVKAWKANNSTCGKDWSSVGRFSSSGEASNAKDYHWLSARVKGYAPVIEYIGGTELAGGYMSGSLVQPQAASHFSVLAFGANLRLLDSETSTEISAGQMRAQIAKTGICEGEVAIVPPLFGSSYKLLNRDHDEVYFTGMPCTAEGMRMRKHGDMLAFGPGGYIRAMGRTDDTMNLGGIKTSSLEIENVCNASIASVALAGAEDQLAVAAAIKEVAAVAIPPAGGGPDLLWICAATKGGGRRGSADGASEDSAALAALQKHFQRAIAKNLNPLFKVHKVVLVEELPRTASNKIMRKALRAQCVAQSQPGSPKL